MIKNDENRTEMHRLYTPDYRRRRLDQGANRDHEARQNWDKNSDHFMRGNDGNEEEQKLYCLRVSTEKQVDRKA